MSTRIPRLAVLLLCPVLSFATGAASDEKRSEGDRSDAGEERGRRRPERKGDRRRREPPEELRRRFDANGDGELDEKERVALREFLRERFGRGGRRGGPRVERLEVVEKFDGDGDGRLNVAERAEARKYVKEMRAARPDRGGPGRGPRPPLFGGEGEAPTDEPREPEKVPVDRVETYSGRGFYEPGVLRTLFLTFPQRDWEEELSDFYRTDVEIPSDLLVDGTTYPSVGVRFRGNSSFFSVPPGKKRSFNIAIDHAVDGQRLFGYKTLNLLNSNADPSFLREILYYHISREFIPAARANLVKVVINGESWGIYVNVQQFNKELLEEWFGTRDGVRWKISQGRGGVRSLRYDGDDLEAYKRSFDLKTAENAAASWTKLVQFAKVLDETPADRLIEAVSPILDIDETLWYLALENVFTDEGYVIRGADYLLFLEPTGRFHFLSSDNNETFGLGTGGPGRGRRGRRGPGGFGRRPGATDRPDRARPRREPERERRAGGRGRPGRGERRLEESSTLDPLAHELDEDRPVISKLLAVPELRARYLAHVRTIAEEWLDWKAIGPIAEGYRKLVGAEVEKDVKKLYSTAAFVGSIDGDVSGRRRPVPGLRSFAQKRREFLLGHPEISKPRPAIASVQASCASGSSPTARDPVIVSAEVSGDVKPAMVLLYYSGAARGPFERAEMKASGKGAYEARIPALPTGTVVRYYVEARTSSDIGTTVFQPEKAAAAPLTYLVCAPPPASFAVGINEIMASNRSCHADPQGEHDDWIELHNLSDGKVDLSELYLSDDPKNPRKWRFPAATSITPGGYLIVWADEDGTDRPGLHASFTIQSGGGQVLLVDADGRGNRVLDSVVFSSHLRADRSLGRVPDGSGGFRVLRGSPGRSNKD